MKNKSTLITILICFFSVIILAQEKQAEIEFETNSIDYGQIDFESDGTRVFKFKNIGDVPLVFTRISSSCGCTIPKKPEKPIEPGAEGQIEVNYDTKRVGIFRKAVTVNSNAKTPTVILRIMGEVLEEEEEEEEEEVN
ncbi:MAG: DUF1573 domain-containing protein [Cryomorphaceae bacterium]|nr:MAG: DUF1573 domain-containing protein [Cryomorphaceae bacterium]